MITIPRLTLALFLVGFAARADADSISFTSANADAGWQDGQKIAECSTYFGCSSYDGADRTIAPLFKLGLLTGSPVDLSEVKFWGTSTGQAAGVAISSESKRITSTVYFGQTDYDQDVFSLGELLKGPLTGTGWTNTFDISDNSLLTLFSGYRNYNSRDDADHFGAFKVTQGGKDRFFVCQDDQHVSDPLGFVPDHDCQDGWVELAAAIGLPVGPPPPPGCVGDCGVTVPPGGPIAPVPEPSAVWLLASGVAGLVAWRRLARR